MSSSSNTIVPAVAILSYQGQNVPLDIPLSPSSCDGDGGGLALGTQQLHTLVFQALDLSPDEVTLKILWKGKRLLGPTSHSSRDDDDDTTATIMAQFVAEAAAAAGAAAATAATKKKKQKPPKLLVLASARTCVDALNAKKQDPTIRGFDDQEQQRNSSSSSSSSSYWGPELSKRHKDYKVGRLQECSFHDFGHRPTDKTPHAFEARQLLSRLATDPGIVAILKERELYVGTLGEMDPIDDRLMKKKQQAGACLLGYNTNHGLRIDIKLRSDDLTTFRPYIDLVATLIHELSHNWVGDHNALFWANYGQMRVEYFWAHKQLSSLYYRGQTSAQLADIPSSIIHNDYNNKNGIVEFVLQELQREMAQHQLHPNMIETTIRQRYQELVDTTIPPSLLSGQRLGGNKDGRGSRDGATTSGNNPNTTTRNLALEAAERRRLQQQAQQEKQPRKENDDNYHHHQKKGGNSNS